VARLIENAKHNAIHSQVLGGRDIALNDGNFFVGITEIAASRPNDHLQANGYSGAYGFNQPGTGSNATFDQAAAQLDTSSAAALRSHRGCNRVDADFYEYLFIHLCFTDPQD
jgi:hypothetical protein